MGRVWWLLGNLSKVLQALGSEFRFAGLGSLDLETHIVLEAPLDMFDSHIRGIRPNSAQENDSNPKRVAHCYSSLAFFPTDAQEDPPKNNSTRNAIKKSMSRKLLSSP